MFQIRCRNALSLAMLESIAANLVDSDDLRAIVLAANGPAFSAGHDLKELVIYNCHYRALTLKCSPDG